MEKNEELVTKENLVKVLENNVIEITFIKTTGDERVMKCTLLKRHLPKENIVKLNVEQTNQRENENIISVWDLGKNAWRSFRVDSVIKLVGKVKALKNLSTLPAHMYAGKDEEQMTMEKTRPRA